MRVLRSPLDATSCALLPSDCALCGFPLPLLSSVPICDACWGEIPIQEGSVCLRCGHVLGAADLHSGTCRPCRLAPPAFARAVSYGPYEGRMRDAIHALKYNGLRPLATRLGAMLASAMAGMAAIEPEGEMLVVPVPLHRSKYAQRGFNHARLLAAHALATLRKTHPDWRLKLTPTLVVRQRATDSQAGLTRRQRRLNVRGAFVVPDRETVRDKHVLVVDDIMTTGATARSMAQVLVRAGAANVWVATLARAHQAYPFSGLSGHADLNERAAMETSDDPVESERATGVEWETSSQASF